MALAMPGHQISEYRVIWRNSEEDGLQGLREVLIDQAQLKMDSIRPQLTMCDAETRAFLEGAVRAGEHLVRELEECDGDVQVE